MRGVSDTDANKDDLNMDRQSESILNCFGHVFVGKTPSPSISARIGIRDLWAQKTDVTVLLLALNERCMRKKSNALELAENALKVCYSSKPSAWTH